MEEFQQNYKFKMQRRDNFLYIIIVEKFQNGIKFERHNFKLVMLDSSNSKTIIVKRFILVQIINK